MHPLVGLFRSPASLAAEILVLRVCTENHIRVYQVTESAKLALICFVLAVLASPFKSKSGLEAENAVLRHQLIVLQRKVRGRAHLTINDR